jgi:hypothetical protein
MPNTVQNGRTVRRNKAKRINNVTIPPKFHILATGDDRAVIERRLREQLTLPQGAWH